MLFGFNNSFYLLRTLTKTVVIIVTRGNTNSVFLSQSKIINQMLCIYFIIDISDKIISELIFQTRRISTRMVLVMFLHYVCIVETQANCNKKDFSDKEYYNNRMNLFISNQSVSQQLD